MTIPQKIIQKHSDKNVFAYTCNMNQKLKSEETQKLLMERAFMLFYRNGYAATSIPDIVKEAGLSKGAFYHHFKSKKEIGEKVVAYVLRKRTYDGMIAPLKNQGSKGAIPTLVELFSDRINNFTTEETRLGCPLNNLINELGCTEESFRTGLRSIIEEWKNVLIDFLEKGKEKKEIRADIDTSTTAIYLISAFEGARGIGKLYDDSRILQEYLIGVTAYIKNLK